MKANFVWDLPDIQQRAAPRCRALGCVVNDWQISGIWTGATGAAYTVGFSYQSGGGNVNLTGSPDYGARIRVVGDPGGGCSSDRYRQFNAAAFQGPLVGSVGLESGSRLPARLLHERARPGDRAQHPAAAAAATSSCASTCSTRRTRRSSPGATRR